MKRIFQAVCIVVLSVCVILSVGAFSNACAGYYDRYGGYHTGHPRHYRHHRHYRHYRNTRYNRAYQHCARAYPVGSYHFQRCMNYNLRY